jgi:transposase, IS5 family
MDGKLLCFWDYKITTAKKQARWENFLSEMEVMVVPWQALIDLIEPHYPKTIKKGCRPPYPLATMLGVISCSSSIRSAMFASPGVV